MYLHGIMAPIFKMFGRDWKLCLSFGKKKLAQATISFLSKQRRVRFARSTHRRAHRKLSKQGVCYVNIINTFKS